MENIILILIFIMLAVCIFVVVSEAAEPLVVDWLPDAEIAVLNDVALQYGLNALETRLLFVIRRIENGRMGSGVEMGVLAPQARRYAGNAEKSLRLQAEWTAGTIKKRFNGDLASFADRWCPVGASNDQKGLNKNWLRNAKHYMVAK